MGFYIEVPKPSGKAEQIRDIHGGEVVEYLDALKAITDPSKGVIVVLNNGPFEAAGFAFSSQEFFEFTNPLDSRPKKYVILPRLLAEKLSRFSSY